MKSEKKNYTFEDYINYQQELVDLVEKDVSKRFYNDSFVHAALVIEALIRKAIKKHCDTIYMYCGEFSLFREQKAKELREEIARVEPSPDNEKLHSQWEKFKPYESLVAALKDYLAHGKMKLIVERSLEPMKDEEIWKELEPYFRSGAIESRLLQASFGLNHFIVAGNSYRRESNQDSKTAICGFDIEKTSEVLISNYQMLELGSEPYTLH